MSGPAWVEVGKPTTFGVVRWETISDGGTAWHLTSSSDDEASSVWSESTDASEVPLKEPSMELNELC